nr:MAG TPA: Morphogenesis protein 1 wall, phi29, hydrolase, infection [Caudoviricetes sp.]
MAWISRNSALNQSEMENNANIIINYYRSVGIDDRTIACILGNMQAESSINPGRYEGGVGPGYGLVQWTPQSSLINHCSTLGLSPYTSGDVQLQVIVEEITGSSSVREWYTSSAFISNYYNSGATSDMIGISGSDFLHNTMGWSADKLAVLFMAGYERPSYDPNVNHYQIRQTFALNWLQYMGGVVPPTPTPGNEKNKFNFVLFNKRRRWAVQ